MKATPIQPATLTFNEQGLPWSAQFGDIYHPKAGAFAQARHVFLRGNRLPERWQSVPSQRFVILETGLGLANNFLATWQAWRATPEPRSPLDFVALELHPFTAADLKRAHARSPCPELIEALLAQWPALTHNLHVLSFEGGKVRLLLALGDALKWLPELQMQVDAIYLDGFAPSRNPELWQPKVFKALARLSKPDSTVATWSAARSVRDGLHAAGFEVTLAPGHGDKRDITLGRYAPCFTPRSPRQSSPVTQGGERHALIIGAGLAGCATAWGLAQVGWRSTVLDAATAPACGASGNPAGLFHGIVNAQDGTHSRLYRSAALAIHKVVQEAIKHHGVQGSTQGLWRLETRRSEAQMQALLSQLGLPEDYVQAHSPSSAAHHVGWPLSANAWWFPFGGWVDPAALCRAYLAMADHQANFKGGQSVASLQADVDGWTAYDSQGHRLGTAPAVVLCNAGDVLRLVHQPKHLLTAVRGQVSWCSTLSQAAALGWPAQGPHQPLAGSGYALRMTHSQCLWGATSQVDDLDPLVREQDHVSNLMQWARLRGITLNARDAQQQIAAAQVQGRVGWRWSCADKLPLWGAMPAGPFKRESLRFAPRVSGLWMCTGMGSRGITWSALAGQVMAALISNTACPLEASLLNAVDPGRLLQSSRN